MRVLRVPTHSNQVAHGRSWSYGFDPDSWPSTGLGRAGPRQGGSGYPAPAVEVDSDFKYLPIKLGTIDSDLDSGAYKLGPPGGTIARGHRDCSSESDTQVRVRRRPAAAVRTARAWPGTQPPESQALSPSRPSAVKVTVTGPHWHCVRTTSRIKTRSPRRQ